MLARTGTAGFASTTTDWTLTLKNLFFPQFCFECGIRLLTEENGYFCPTCWELPRRIARPFCDVCGQPQGERLGFGPVANYTCSACRQADSKQYRRVYGAVDYAGAMAGAVKMLKFYDKRRIAGPIADVMREFARREMPCERFDDIVPVPLHPVRHRDRGFNQAEVLAAAIAPVFPNARVNTRLRRIRPTRIQSRISDEVKRRENVRGAFAVDAAYGFSGRTVLLVDDVVTTGGTVSECAAALRRADAACVDVFAAALPVRDGGATTPASRP